jgi:hypothetical protein
MAETKPTEYTRLPERIGYGAGDLASCLYYNTFALFLIFPCAALADAATGRIAIFYGAADSYTALAFCYVDELLPYLKENSDLTGAG